MPIVQLPLPFPQDVIIPLTKGFSTVVSWEDRDLAEIKWTAMVEKNNYVRAYRQGYNEDQTKRRNIYLSRVIYERIIGRSLEQTELVDHADLNPLNNCRDNLRLATKSTNLANSMRPNKHGLKGVYQSGRKWCAGITFQGVKQYLGIFDTPEAAHQAYADEATRLHGEFARLE